LSFRKIFLQSLILLAVICLLAGCNKTESNNQILQDISNLKTATHERVERIEKSNIELASNLLTLETQILELQKQIQLINAQKTSEKNIPEINQMEIDIEKVFEMICDPKTKENLTKKIESSESNVEGGQQMLFLISLICG
tara:strand:+ start:520 stop:942 length:423 start_codon:yes stop_codon:yes gene_type:complete